MSDFAKKELLKTIRSASATYLDLRVAEARAANLSQAGVDAAIAAAAEEIKKTVDCSAQCESAYNTCMSQPGADPAVCLQQKDDCLIGCGVTPIDPEDVSQTA